MIKICFFVAFAIGVNGCRTMVDPGAKHAPRTLEEMDMAVEQGSDEKETLLIQSFPEKITDEEKKMLKDRYFRKHSPINENDIEFVTGQDYKKCKKSDWICPIEDGVWACYCKLNNQRRR